MDIIAKYQKVALANKELDAGAALELFLAGTQYPYRIIAAAAEIREHFKGLEIILCGMVNAKSGKCPEDCSFCAHSSFYETGTSSYPLKKAAFIIAEAEEAASNGSELFGIVTNSKIIAANKEWSEIFQAIAGITKIGLKPCASLGILDEQKARNLKSAGLHRYHHNLETSRSFFPSICTTHSYEEDVETLQIAKYAGLSVCSGGIIGLGEGITQRIELAETLRQLDVDSVSLNILNPIKGTPLSGKAPLSPLEILITISVFRFMLPARDIRLCGGKEKNLRQLLPMAIVAGANSFMTGNYLTTNGRSGALDCEMITDLGLQTSREAKPLCNCEMRERKNKARQIAAKKEKDVK